MIVDYYKNYGIYEKAVPGLAEGMKLVEMIQDKPAGTYHGEHGIFAMVQEGETYDISTDKIEAHVKYLDVQIVLSGQEIMEWEEISKLELADAYDETKDVAFYKGKGKAYQMTAGMFYILFPQDGHKARGKVKETGEAYRKIVLKLPVK